MASRNPSTKEVKIQLVGEFGKGFKELKDSIKAMNIDIHNLLEEIKKMTSATSTEFNKMSVDIKKTSSDAANSMNTMADTAKKLGEETKKAANETKKSSKAMAEWWNRVKIFSQYRIIGAIAGSARDLAASSVELEASFANIQAITRASDATMGKLRDTILRVGEASKYSVEEIARATTMLGQAGLSADEINNVLETTTQLAAGTGSELSNTVDLMTSALAVWGLNSEEATHLSDVMVTGMNRTKATLETFRMAVQYAGATMASLNVSFDEFASVAAAASNAGLRASVVGTGLRAMTSELISPTRKMVSGLAQLGLSTEDVNIESQGLVNVLYKLKNAGLTAANAYDLFGKRAAQFVLAAQGQLDIVDELQVAFKESGATLKAYGTQMDTISAQWTALGNTVKESASNVLDSISWIIKGILEGINDIFKALNWLFSDKLQETFTETAKKLEDEKIAAKSFYDFVEQLRSRDYGGNTSEAIEDLNDVIDKMNEKFGTTISYVDPLKNIADEFERIKNEAKSIGEIKIAGLEENRLNRANQLLSEENFYTIGQLSNKYGRDFTGEFRGFRSEYYNALANNGGDTNKIKREITRDIEDVALKEVALAALEEAKRIFELSGGVIKSTFRTEAFDKELIKLETESKETSEDIKSFLAALSKNVDDAGEALNKTTRFSSDEVANILKKSEDAENELREINARTNDEWEKLLDEKGILKKEEQEEYIQKVKESKKRDVERYINVLNNILNGAEKEFEKGISSSVTKQIRDDVNKRLKGLTSVNKTSWEAYVSSLDNKFDKSDRRTQREIERDKARRFNLKYQNLAIQQQADEYQASIAQATRKGIQSRLAYEDRTGTMSGAYGRYSSDKERFEKFKTAYANKRTLDEYMKDYGTLFNQVEKREVTLEDADNKSDKLISKMIALQTSIKEAEGDFGELNETNLDKVNKQIDDLDEKMKKLEEDSKTVTGQFKIGFADAIRKMVDTYSIAKLGSTIAEDIGNGLSDAIYSVADGTKSMKDAFSDMTKSILQDISKMLIKMAVLKAMEATVFGMSAGGSVQAATQGQLMIGAEYAKGGFIPKIRAALGTPVRGGIQGKDSVPAMLMPGEYVLKKSAVDALGTNFLNDLNNNAAQTLTGTVANLMSTNSESLNKDSEPAVVNVWVVSKEEDAKMGPNDVIATIGKDIMTGGQTRKLIQSVVAGRK